TRRAAGAKETDWSALDVVPGQVPTDLHSGKDLCRARKLRLVRAGREMDEDETTDAGARRDLSGGARGRVPLHAPGGFVNQQVGARGETLDRLNRLRIRRIDDRLAAVQRLDPHA